MAINFASVVPKEAVEAAGADFGKKPVGSGAFTSEGMGDRPEARLREEPRLLHQGPPNVDGFTVEIGQEPLVALLRLQKGEVDIAGDGIPPAKFLEMKKSPDVADMIVDREQLETGYVTLNTQVKPLDNVKVRQALNMAINKERIIRIVNGRATPANQLLPPLMPGYDKAYKGYAYDVAKAKALLAEAGLKDGFSTMLYASNTDPNPRIAQAIQQDLAAIGVKAETQGTRQSERDRRGRHEGRGADDLVGRHRLDRRLPGSVRLLRTDPRLRRRHTGGWNWSWYCNEAIEPRAQAADAMPMPAKEAERAEVWKQDLHRHPGQGCPVDSGLQRAPRRRQVEAHGRPGRDLHRSDARHRLRRDLHQEISRQVQASPAQA